MNPPAGAEGEIVQVAPLVGVRSLGKRIFDYRLEPMAPSENAIDGRDAGIGSVVAISFGRRQARGVVWGLGPSGEHTGGRLSTARVVSQNRVPAELLQLAERMADYYLAPLGACLRAVLPAHLSPAPRSAGGRVVGWVRPTGDPLRTPEGESAGRLTPRQEAVLGAVPPEGVSVSELCRRTGASRSVVDALVKRGRLHLERRSVLSADVVGGDADEDGDPSKPAATPGASPGAPVLTEEQERALSALEEAMAAPTAERRLLWGVTGSGKTELYVHLLRAVVDRGGGAIVLVPEIALSGQLGRRLEEGLGVTVAVLHSALGRRRRERAAAEIAAGRIRVVVGARSAVFAPVRDLRLVIVDEAHDASFKQEEEPRYDARAVAGWRLETGPGLLVEGTATPRLESVVRPEQPIRLHVRPTGGAMPAVEVVDMRRQGSRALIAPRARQALQDALGRGEQAVILLNRRGYSGFVRCAECGVVRMCPHCEISLTYHRQRGALMCHHCGFQASPPSVCPACGAGPLERGSPGTERLRDELLRLVPRSRLFRLDSDVVTSGTRVHEVLSAFAESRPGVLLGTQMVAKGHDFPDVTLVVVADADTALYLPDFRAGERTFQLLTQVAGRAGRGERPGRVLVQTWNPDVACIRMAISGDEQGFYAQELALRERLGYPPFRDLVRLLLVSRHEERAEKAAEHLAERLRPFLREDELRGPARLPRLRGLARWQVLVAGSDGRRARELVGLAVGRLRAPYARRGGDGVCAGDPQWFT